MINSLTRSEIRKILNELKYQLSLMYYVSDTLEQQMHSEKDEMKNRQIQNELNEVEDFIKSAKEKIENFALIIGVKIDG